MLERQRCGSTQAERRHFNSKLTGPDPLPKPQLRLRLCLRDGARHPRRRPPGVRRRLHDGPSREAVHGGAGGGVVRVQHRGAAAQQVPPLRLRLPLPRLPHRLPHVRLRPPLQPRPLRRLPLLHHLLAFRRALPRPARQGGRAGGRLLRLRRRRERLPPLPPRLLQPGRRRHHALLHRPPRLRRRRQDRGVGHLRRTRTRRRRRRHRHRGRAELPPLRIRNVRGGDGGAGAQDRAAGDLAVVRGGEAQLHGPAPLHGPGGRPSAGSGNTDHGARRAWRGGHARAGGPQFHLDTCVQLISGIFREPDQLPGHQAHQPAYASGSWKRERRCGCRGFHPDIQEPGNVRGDARLRDRSCRRCFVWRDQEKEQVSLTEATASSSLLVSWHLHSRRYVRDHRSVLAHLRLVP